MKNLCDPAIAKWRDHEADRLYRTKDEERSLGGAFLVPYANGMKRYLMRVIASSGKDQPPGWQFDHVSVSLSSRTPTWEEMDYVKRLFFHPDEICYQLHVSAGEHINNHPYCLHIWHCLEAAIPLPPGEMVGAAALNPEALRQGALPGVQP
ncbi:MAG: hypothetical protein DMF06_05215 [Verrucomicrobia bacterium]|nr:MAG: hypothetical protein DMF06_05215 [Verrucomicrobiota bacterium]